MSTVLREAASKAAQELAMKLQVPANVDTSELALLYEQLMVNAAGGINAEPNVLWTEELKAESFLHIQTFGPPQASAEMQAAVQRDLDQLLPDVQALVTKHMGPAAEGGKNPLALVSALSSVLAYVAVSNGMHPAVFFQSVAGMFGQTMNQVQAAFANSSAVVKDAEGNIIGASRDVDASP